MNYPDAGQRSTVIYSPRKKPFPVVRFVLGMSAVFGIQMAFSVTGAIKGIQAVPKTSVEAAAVGNQFLDSMGQHNYDAARSLLLPEAQAITPTDTLKNLEIMEEKRHGVFVNHRGPQGSVQSWNGQTSVHLLYPVQFARSNSPVSMTLIATEKGYRLQNCRYQL